MNIQSMMKQAQKLQKEMMQAKKEIDEKIYFGKSSFVSVEMFGTKKVKQIKIEKENIIQDEIEMLEDMILISINDAMAQIDKETTEKLGKYTNGMPGLF